MSPVVGGQSPNHWATRELPPACLYVSMCSILVSSSKMSLPLKKIGEGVDGWGLPSVELLQRKWRGN